MITRDGLKSRRNKSRTYLLQFHEAVGPFQDLYEEDGWLILVLGPLTKPDIKLVFPSESFEAETIRREMNRLCVKKGDKISLLRIDSKKRPIVIRKIIKEENHQF